MFFKIKGFSQGNYIVRGLYREENIWSGDYTVRGLYDKVTIQMMELYTERIIK